MKQKKKSPLKDKPLRYMGQSLDERIDNLLNVDASSYIVLILFCVVGAAHEWWRYFRNPPPSPVLITLLAIIGSAFGIYRIRTILKKVKSIRLGRDGERAVGQYLELLREKGHRVYHDILGENFNIDHVIISRKGVFIIETKTYSKPLKGEANICFDGKKISIKIISFIENFEVIETILRHLGLWDVRNHDPPNVNSSDTIPELFYDYSDSQIPVSGYWN